LPRSLYLAAALSCLRLLAGGAVPAAAQEVETTDDLGRRLVLPDAPRRIVSLVPVVTEILFAVEADHLLVGRSAYADYPPEVRRIASVGDAIRPAAELVLERNPDLAILIGGSDNAAAVAEFDRLGIPSLAVVVNTLEDLGRTIARLGRLVGREREANVLWGRIQEELDEVQAAVKGRSKLSVYYDVAYPPIITAGGSSYLDTLIAIAGGRNIFGDLAAPSPTVSLEVIAFRDPDVIIHPVSGTSGRTLPPFQRPGWGSVRAVRSGSVVQVDADLLHRLGPRVGQAARALATVLHPGAFEAHGGGSP
jgi:iron complex transport system substrate-binding protein